MKIYKVALVYTRIQMMVDVPKRCSVELAQGWGFTNHERLSTPHLPLVRWRSNLFSGPKELLILF